MSSSRIRLIEEAIHNFGDPANEIPTETEAILNAIQDPDDLIKKGMLNTKDPDQDLPAEIETHRVVEACMQVCWACDDYGQTVIQPSSIGCCSRPKFPTHAEHICTACIDEINKQMGGEDRS